MTVTANGGPLKVWGIAGSLRADSVNRKLLAAAQQLAPAGVDVQITELLADIPMFNEDLVAEAPEAVEAMRAEVAAADALLIATPEYNGGVPGVLKNALDWLSLPLGRSVLHRMPVAVMGASPGRLGTARSQLELRTTLLFSQSPVVPGPELILSFAGGAFDETGQLTDEVAIDRLGSLLDGLQRFSRLNETEEVLA